MFAYEWRVLLQRVPSNPPTRPVTAGRRTNEMVFAIHAVCPRYTQGTPRVHIRFSLLYTLLGSHYFCPMSPMCSMSCDRVDSMVLLWIVPSNLSTRPVSAVGDQTRGFLLAIYVACLRYSWGTPRVHSPIFTHLRSKKLIKTWQAF